MGILNVTPDSFSDGGRYESGASAFEQAEKMVLEGASIIDVGGESTRPGAAPVDASEEQRRILPVIEAIARRLDAIISVDTYRSETARFAIAAGAHAINDVTGLHGDKAIADVARTSGAGLVVMHTGRGRTKFADVIDDQDFFFRASLDVAKAASVQDDSILLDPGFGFAKETPEENLDLMARFEALHALGYPLVAGTSRKRFIGAVTGRDAWDRDAGTAATNVILRLKGASVFRVHNVAMNRDALAVADAMLAREAAWEL